MMLSKLLDYLLPLRSISESLKKMADLYELDCNARGVHLITEKPSEDDTEVWYGNGDEDKKKRRFGVAGDWFNKDLRDDEK